MTSVSWFWSQATVIVAVAKASEDRGPRLKAIGKKKKIKKVEILRLSLPPFKFWHPSSELCIVSKTVPPVYKWMSQLWWDTDKHGLWGFFLPKQKSLNSWIRENLWQSVSWISFQNRLTRKNIELEQGQFAGAIYFSCLFWWEYWQKICHYMYDIV